MKRIFLALLLSPLCFWAHSYDVIVVGAGISGIAAAKELHEAGLDVLVLEARNHIGGRAHTSFFPNHPSIGVDLGAAWIQETHNNPLIPLAEKYGARNQLFDDDSVDYFDCSPPFQTPPLHPLDSDPIDELRDQIDDKIEELQAKKKEMSLAEGLEPWIATFSQKKQDAIWYILACDIEQEYAADCSQLSLLYYNDDDTFGGPDNLMIDGYQPLINGLAASLMDENRIHLEQFVSQITHSDSGVEVIANGTTYTADYVICTVPLGVIQQDTVQFTPPLTEKMREAINRLKMGLLDKAVLLFPSIFWDSSKNRIDRIPPSEGEWVENIDYFPFSGRPMLVAFNAGEAAAKYIETKSDDEVIESFMGSLRAIYGDAIPDPIDWVITRWGQDPFSYGSYAYSPPFSTMEDYDTLATPQGRLHFAGEATSSYSGTTHGAYLSGLRAAKEILNSERVTQMGAMAR